MRPYMSNVTCNAMAAANTTYSGTRDVEMSDAEQYDLGRSMSSHFKIAIDFGTTCSVVAVLSRADANDQPDDQPQIDPEKIPLIAGYPSAPTSGWEARYDVPSESWYPDARRSAKRQKSTVRNSVSPTSQTNSPTSFDVSVSDEEREAQEDMEEELAAQRSPQYLWGYEVPTLLDPLSSGNDQGHKMTRFKLLLDERQQTSRVREKLTPMMERLQELNRIRDKTDVIADYLGDLFKHVHDQLVKYHSFSQTCSVEFVLCVPAIWTPQACRIMQTAMQRAIANSGLSTLNKGSIDNLFIVSEPEAAALCVLPDSRHILPSDTFVIIDAGGGTVDAVSYTVSQRFPLRLKRQVVTGGALCGSSFLNERFEALLRERLSKVDLHGCSDSLEEVIEKAVNEFENNMKRAIDIFDRESCRKSINIRGLRMDRKGRASNGRLHFSLKEFEQIFEPCLSGVQRIMEEQLTFALSKNLNITNVILTGGFAASPSLQKKIQIGLDHFNTRHALNPRIGLLKPHIPGAAVARGAILRALRKKDGPSRIIQSSFGFLRRELYNERNAVHLAQKEKATEDPIDKLRYLFRTISWLVKRGEEVQALQERSIPTSHTFSLHHKTFLCEEILYVIDIEGRDSYTIDHPVNQGAEEVGKIVVDMTFLKTRDLIHPLGPYPGTGSKRQFYDVEFDLVMRIDDRNLHFEARWPRREREGDRLGEVKESGQISIAAAFQPGTK